MPGGNKNIKPEDGKQFSKEYQPPEKWTEDKSLEVGNELIAWLNKDDANIFFEEFLYIENDYYANLIGYLAKKFSSFSELLQKARKIQEIKLMKFGVFDKLNASMTKFTLINNHNWAEKKEIISENVHKINEIDYSKLSQKTLNTLLNELKRKDND